MRIHIDHLIQYEYERPVFHEPLILRLRPRADGAQRLERFELEIDPRPVGRSELTDLDGISSTVVWFEELHRTLSIRGRSDVTTLRANPFDFFITDPDAVRLPVRYPPILAGALAPYRHRENPAPEVDRLAREVSEAAGGDVLRFLEGLTRRLAGQFQSIVREDGPALPPREILANPGATCRDLAVLFMAASRSVGLAARFVSGYRAERPPPKRSYLHAWAEVYLPGGGWRAYDPTAGLAVTDEHVALAAAAEPLLAAPTSGSYRGTGVGSTISYDVRVERMDALPGAS